MIFFLANLSIIEITADNFEAASDLSGAIGYSVNFFNNNLLTFYLGYDYSNYRNKNYGATQLAYKGRTFPSNQLFQKYYFKTRIQVI